jgi:ketosteroid isomerase-like protein
MSQENVAIVDMLLEKFRAGDHDVFEHYDAEIEWDATRGAEHVAEIANLYRGHEGVRAYWREWLTAWQPMEIWDYELRDAGESVVALISGQRNRGRHSGIEIEVPPYALVFTLRERKVVRWAFYSDQREAFEAAGASE